MRIGLALATATAATAGLLWTGWHRDPPQIITLADGRQLRFAGVTYGTNHSQPMLAARLTDQLPAPQANLVRKRFGKRLGLSSPYHTQLPSLCVWFQPLGTNQSSTAGRYPLHKFMLTDQDGVEAGRGCSTPLPNMTGIAMWHYAVFQFMPKRSPTLQCCLYGPASSDGRHRELGRVRFPNPLFGRFPQWQPEPVPAVKQAGDLEVRLGSLMIATGIYRVNRSFGEAASYRPVAKGESPETVLDVVLSPLGGSNDIWTMQSAELSDATGNRILESRLDRRGRDRISIDGALWPDDAAWRLRLEVKRKSGPGSDRLVAFRNVPVPKVGAQLTTPLTNVVGGIEVVLEEFLRQPDIGAMTLLDNVTRIRIDLPGKPTGAAVDCVRIATSTGAAPVPYFDGWSDSSESIYLNSIPVGVQALDITCAVREIRSVEFLVKPPPAQ
jgi:hypothetical protein